MLNDHMLAIGTAIIHADTAWLAHIIVHKNYRNQGLGTFITKQLLNSAPVKNIKTVNLIATDMGEPVYKKLGFKIVTEYILYKEVNIPHSNALHNIHALTQDRKQNVLDMDKQISGEERSRLLEQYLNNGYVYMNGNEIEGFYLPTLGEGWIAATSQAAGIALMQLRFTQKENASFPAGNIAAINFLKLHTIPEFRRVKRMILGDNREWQPQNIYNRAGGNLG